MWYYVLDGEKHGPVSEEKIHDLIHDGHLDSESYIWTAEMNDWKPISEVEQFLPKPPPIPSDAIDAAKQGERNSPDEISTDHQSQEKNKYTYASFANRAVALVLDIGFIFFPVIFVGGFIMAMVNDPDAAAAVGRLMGTFAPLLYFVGLEGSVYDATPGKRLIGLRVTDLNHNPIGYGRALGRYVSRILSTLPVLLGYLAPLFMEKNQTFHDYAAGCLVVKE